MPEKVAGLPAHPLIIHLPLILGPVVGLLTLLLLVPRLREKLLLPAAGLGVLFAISAIVAVMSGQDFAKVVGGGPGLGEHADAAKTLRLLSVILAALLVAFAIGRKRVPAVAATGLAVVVAALGVATVAFTIDTGHKGAELVWGDVAGGGSDDASSAEEAESREAAGDSSGSSSGEDSASHGSGSAEDHGMSPEDHDAMESR